MACASEGHRLRAGCLLVLALLCTAQCARQLRGDSTPQVESTASLSGPRDGPPQLPGPQGPGGVPFQPSYGAGYGGGGSGYGSGGGGYGSGSGGYGGSGSNNNNQGYNPAPNTVTAWSNGQVDAPPANNNNNNNNNNCNIGNNAIIASGNNCNFNNNNNNGGGSGGGGYNNNNNNNNNYGGSGGGGLPGPLGLLGLLTGAAGGSGGGLPDPGALIGGALQLIVGFATGGGIPPLSQVLPFNLGELMNLSATQSTAASPSSSSGGDTNAITSMADSMLANLASNNAPVVTSSLANSLTSGSGGSAVSSAQAFTTASTFAAAASKANRVQPSLSPQVGQSFAAGLDDAMGSCVSGLPSGSSATQCCTIIRQTLQDLNSLAQQAGTTSVFSGPLSNYPRVQACQQQSN